MIPDIRTGFGFDVHRLIPGDGMYLGGVFIPGKFALLGHSDADALLHAICDAILGAIGEEDIGRHFPPSDPQWAGAASDQFVLHAVSLLNQRGGRLLNVDTLIICETPKIGPHRAMIRERLGQILSLPQDRVNVKATTTETLGFTGRKEGLAAQAAVSIFMGHFA
ncbi:MAG: 2-C-methyl-D-erythritol 2,4-cyclodiphosphate synthase [Alphaproteobacteria bacterium]|nr:2-C-methyl-D-erythritol 2,4-cyclodiphosphate synthase [Alphaproteobacteria bacterium]